MRNVTVAAVQLTYGLDKAEEQVRLAAKSGANIILLPELFETPYFCQLPLEKHFALAKPLDENVAVSRFQKIAKELGVVLLVSFFERKNNAYYNSLVVIDADGAVMDTYRKSHIPDGFGYNEKFFFNPGDTGFKVWDTAFGKIGCAICWDQWFPEAARVMALQGAELLFYPTAIGSEPQDQEVDSHLHWQTCMQGHAAANLMPVIASNRIGHEDESAHGHHSEITFYGGSFITDEHGLVISKMDNATEGFIKASFDLDSLMCTRRAWGVFRDRRPELYTPILTLDGGK